MSGGGFQSGSGQSEAVAKEHLVPLHSQRAWLRAPVTSGKLAAGVLALPQSEAKKTATEYLRLGLWTIQVQLPPVLLVIEQCRDTQIFHHRNQEQADWHRGRRAHENSRVNEVSDPKALVLTVVNSSVSQWIRIVFFLLLGPHLRPMKVPRLGDKSELPLLVYTTSHGDTEPLTH